MQRWRRQGRAPTHLQLGQRILYRLCDVEAFEAGRLTSVERVVMAARPESVPTVQPDWDAIETFCEVVFGYATGFAPIRILSEKGGPDRKP